MRELDRAAKEASTKYYVDEELKKSFVAGAKWTLEQFIQMISVHPMEDSAGARQLCDGFRLKEVNKFIREMTKIKND